MAQQMRSLFVRLVTNEGLHYCCVHAFFTQHETTRTSLISLRLGVHTRTVKRHRAMFRKGEYQCQSSERCMKAREILKRS